ELKRFCATRAEFQEPVTVDNGRGVECVYENTKTGTTFVLEYDDPATRTGDDETVIPKGFVETGLSFNINFGRPPSYGREAMPIVVDLMTALDVYVEDPQDHGGSVAHAKKCDAEELIRSWDDGNVLISPTGLVSRRVRARVDRYMDARDRIQDSLGDQYYVPSLFFMRRTTKRRWLRPQRVLVVSTWTNGIPMLFPRCDRVVLMRLHHDATAEDPTPLRTGVVSYRRLARRLRPFLEPYRDAACPGALMIPMRHADAVREAFQSFPLSDERLTLEKLYYVFPRRTSWYVQRVVRVLMLVFLISAFGFRIGADAVTQARDAWRRNDATSVVRYAKRALWFTVLPKDRATAHFWFGVGEYRLGNLASAETHERRAIVLQPNHAPPYVTLGAILDASGRRREAWGAAQRAIELDPTYAWAQNLIGVLMLEDGHAAGAVPYFARAMALDSDEKIFTENHQEAIRQSSNQ
ncbi:MAG: hypothetical protein Q7R80_04310, partial [bacterium]|nr:hypothetical protein [bacterium]